ncbi:LOB domain-containing protein [Heracleum sosnowskyi]|uniref:LOB domain-containing protein n=1 Tax=Heracleum sosnowskyi TaxID=360622 RepID=A0AAD8GWE1_9APIA|nr:LOB domain-containing protein [Heracleum sosnowskyi]
MRMSCNGCRVLRKGCTEDCIIRPCLQWINNPESQAHATNFLAKFYGRAGLMNLINGGPDHLRPEIFRSLLYDACGRLVNPVYGSAGLLWSGNWQLCQNAVEAVLRGDPITQTVAIDAAEVNNGPPLKAYDIRHVPKDENNSSNHHRVKNRFRFKRSAGKELNSSISYDSSFSHQSEAVMNGEGGSKETECLMTAGMAEGSASFRAEPEWFVPEEDNNVAEAESEEIELDLTLSVKKGKSI